MSSSSHTKEEETWGSDEKRIIGNGKWTCNFGFPEEQGIESPISSTYWATAASGNKDHIVIGQIRKEKKKEKNQWDHLTDCKTCQGERYTTKTKERQTPWRDSAESLWLILVKYGFCPQRGHQSECSVLWGQSSAITGHSSSARRRQGQLWPSSPTPKSRPTGSVWYFH